MNHAPKKRSKSRRIGLVLFVILAFPILLFAWNGLLLSEGERAIVHTTAHAAIVPGPTIKVMAYNIAKGMAHLGGTRFDSAANVCKRLDTIADLVNKEKPDLVFLSEVLFECTPCPVNQAAYLAQAGGFHAWATGENYNWGLPFYRIVGGNAILSRVPLLAVGNPSLSGRKPFYATNNSRRALIARAQLGGESVMLFSLHNDSFNLANNLVQVREILALASNDPAILAGDFNAEPDQSPIAAIVESGRFTSLPTGRATFPTEKPDRRIDMIFGPAQWKVVAHDTPSCMASDHLPVVTVFELSEK